MQRKLVFRQDHARITRTTQASIFEDRIDLGCADFIGGLFAVVRHRAVCYVVWKAFDGKAHRFTEW